MAPVTNAPDGTRKNFAIPIKRKLEVWRRERKRQQEYLRSSFNEYFERKFMSIPQDVLNKPITSLTAEDIEEIRAVDDIFMTSPVNGRRSKLSRGTRSKRSTQVRRLPSANIKMEKTPANQKPPPGLGMVTPKFNPYAPMSVVRVPKEGEAAMSMEGSPLRITSTIIENRANVVVPLHNGKVLSVLPERGMRMSQIPEIDDDMRRQLKVLNDNINTLLSKSANRF